MASSHLVPLLLFLLVLACRSSVAFYVPRFFPRRVPSTSPKVQQAPRLGKSEPIEKCEERFRTATMNHYTYEEPDLGKETFQQRYFVCSTYWQPTRVGEDSPIFFYLGNEADVELYLNNTGLMWENAPHFGALIVFAEHRYYGKSLPYEKDIKKHMQYLSAEQAMADYAELILELKEEFDAYNSPVIGFGGSYGGMLAAWFRMKYPHILNGAIAASAPIWNFLGEMPAFDSGAFAKGVTFDASRSGGSSPHCADNVREGFATLMEMGKDADGRKRIADAVNLCPKVPFNSYDHVIALRDWLRSAWDSMAMGNFPYPSSYILNGDGVLPAFPVRVACQGLNDPLVEGEDLLAALANASGVFYNFSGEAECFDYRKGANDATDEVEDFWSYQYCTEMVMPFSTDGVNDMFWDAPWDLDETIDGCKKSWNVVPRPMWATMEFGGKDLRSASNIVFSNGLLDPWHGGGVLNDVSESVVSIIIPNGAHHLDLMFSHPDDPQDVIAARKKEVQFIQQWLDEAKRSGRGRGGRTYVQHLDSKSSETSYIRLGKDLVNKRGETI